LLEQARGPSERGGVAGDHAGRAALRDPVVPAGGRATGRTVSDRAAEGAQCGHRCPPGRRSRPVGPAGDGFWADERRFDRFWADGRRSASSAATTITAAAAAAPIATAGECGASLAR